MKNLDKPIQYDGLDEPTLLGTSVYGKWIYGEWMNFYAQGQIFTYCTIIHFERARFYFSPVS